MREASEEDAPPKATKPRTGEWVRVEDIRDEAGDAVARGKGSGRGSEPRTGRSAKRDEAPEVVVDDQAVARFPSAQRDRSKKRLSDAARAYSAERYGDAGRLLKDLAASAPDSPPVRELNGLVLYRQGRWTAAAAELEAFRALTGSAEQNPVLADCYRALKRWALVDELWEEVRAASPSAEIVTEGRIVQAGSLADRGDLRAAIQLLGGDWRVPKRPQEHHLRRAYALADLEERAGDVVRARELFERIAAVDPDFADVTSRLRSLGR